MGNRTREATVTGSTVDRAIENACEQIGLPREEVEIEIISLPKKGFLGLGNTPAKVRVWKEELDSSKHDIAERYITDIISAMGLDGTQISVTKEETMVLIKLSGDIAGIAIGHRGETLDALQYLTGLACNRVEGEYVKVVLDSGNYRDKRKQTLENLAKKLCANVAKSGRSMTLEPMNPYERRIIHSMVSEIEGVTSTSIGEEPNRCVVISSTNPRAQRTDNRGGFNNRGPRPGGGRSGGAPRQDRTGPPRTGGRNDNFKKGGPRQDRGPHRDKPEPYKESQVRETAPAEAANKPLYGKIEL